ncbi:hypothetical protein [Streptosporangium subroseum]|uniref:hypothetical protein n=1 Tax=Streptosporangium subroseum TaxID=106412 RepID=UPI003087AC78|nr:hypothetical protein OHB15_41450 [Streptosporangium subroseum]
MTATNGHDRSFSPIAIFLFAGLGLRMTGGAVGARVVVETPGPPTASAARNTSPPAHRSPASISWCPR